MSETRARARSRLPRRNPVVRANAEPAAGLAARRSVRQRVRLNHLWRTRRSRMVERAEPRDHRIPFRHASPDMARSGNLAARPGPVPTEVATARRGTFSPDWVLHNTSSVHEFARGCAFALTAPVRRYPVHRSSRCQLHLAQVADSREDGQPQSECMIGGRPGRAYSHRQGRFTAPGGGDMPVQLSARRS
jgi:hypothetical protein